MMDHLLLSGSGKSCIVYCNEAQAKARVNDGSFIVTGL